ncbi:hypothetical protein FNH13_17625 [Ornithinimicrobium ciconiae]|uniref:Uncharacterized protein n=1 Tax=Ornithinimicrobium ciconiae TaxID=2594265 RepID=A0A516GEI5_9MICO|nr:hypothetical protein [Ornithinimicrobium ciconiae]QDO89921.1 hypothetical protein FNH13_17625 [Ornithinimicrobium ciconiae]
MTDAEASLTFEQAHEQITLILEDMIGGPPTAWVLTWAAEGEVGMDTGVLHEGNLLARAGLLQLASHHVATERDADDAGALVWLADGAGGGG